MPEEPRELQGWDEIGAYLGVRARSAQEYEKKFGLPVHRMPGRKGRVRAWAHELDSWKQRQSPANLGRVGVGKWFVAGGVLVGALALGATVLLVRRNEPPARYRVDGRELVVLDRHDHRLFSHEFPEAPIVPADFGQHPAIRFEDVDSDGRLEFLFRYATASETRIGQVLYCFGDRGALKWKFIPGRKVRDRQQEFTPAYFVNNAHFLPARGGTDPRVVVTSNHSVHYPNQVAVLDGHGRVLGEYWHSGHLLDLDAADLDGNGEQEIMLAGVNNGYRQATLVVLDPRRVGGASRQPPGDSRQLEGFGPGTERAVVFFPRTCLSQLEEFNRAVEVQITAGEIAVMVTEAADPQPPGTAYVVYHLGYDLRVRAVTPSDAARARHRELEAAGQLRHPLSPAELDRWKEAVKVIVPTPTAGSNKMAKLRQPRVDRTRLLRAKRPPPQEDDLAGRNLARRGD